MHKNLKKHIVLLPGRNERTKIVVFKGKKIGEVYKLRDARPGWAYGYLSYLTDFGAEGHETKEEAICDVIDDYRSALRRHKEEAQHYAELVKKWS